MNVHQISAGEAYVTVTCNDSALVSGLQEISKKIRRSSKDFSVEVKPKVVGKERLARDLASINKKIVGAAEFIKRAWDASKEAIQGVFAAFANQGELEGLAKRLGVNVQTLHEYIDAARLVGASADDVASAFQSSNEALDKAISGDEEAISAFQALGLSVANLADMSADERFDAIAEAIARVEDPVERAATATTVFGGAADNLFGLFSSGVGGLASFREEASRLGGAITEDSASSAAEYSRTIEGLKLALESLGTSIVGMLAPTLTNLAEKFSKVLSSVRNWISTNRDMALVLAKIGASILGAAATIYGLTAAVAKAKAAFAAFQALFSTNPWYLLATAIAAVVAGLMAFNKAQQDRKTHYSDEAKGILEAGNASRKEDEARIERLKELQNQQKLQDSEISEAIELVGELRAKYGDVGIEVDALTGKITGAVEAQAELNRQMAEAKKKELEAALAEAEANGKGDAIARNMAREEVSWGEELFGIERGLTFWQSLKEGYHFSADRDARRLQMLKYDENFQERVAAANQKNDALISSLKAQIEHTDAMLNRKSPDKKTASAQEARDVGKEGTAIVDAYVNGNAEEELTELQKRINAVDEDANKARDALRKLLDPEGKVDWNDSAKVDELMGSSEQAKAIKTQLDRVEQERASQKAKATNQDAQERTDEKNRELSDAKERMAEISRARAEKDMTELERELASIDRETSAYKKENERARQAALGKGDSKEAESLTAQLNQFLAESSKRKQDAKDADKAEANEYLKSVKSQIFYKNAPAFEQLAASEREVVAAFKELKEAEDSKDARQIADALLRLDEAQGKYASAQDAVNAMARETTKSVAGTFSAWQASAMSSTNWEKQLYAENRTQTRYLAQIARSVGKSATFA